MIAPWPTKETKGILKGEKMEALSGEEEEESRGVLHYTCFNCYNRLAIINYWVY
jgi:hypothetical protein